MREYLRVGIASFRHHCDDTEKTEETLIHIGREQVSKVMHSGLLSIVLTA